MIRGRDINTLLDHCKGALDMQMFRVSAISCR